MNDLASTKKIAHLLRNDTNAGRFHGKVEAKAEEEIYIDGHTVVVFHERDPANLRWARTSESMS